MPAWCRCTRWRGRYRGGRGQKGRSLGDGPSSGGVTRGAAAAGRQRCSHVTLVHPGTGLGECRSLQGNAPSLQECLVCCKHAESAQGMSVGLCGSLPPVWAGIGLDECQDRGRPSRLSFFVMTCFHQRAISNTNMSYPLFLLSQVGFFSPSSLHPHTECEMESNS